jgi:hypothetical protein
LKLLGVDLIVVALNKNRIKKQKTLKKLLEKFYQKTNMTVSRISGTKSSISRLRILFATFSYKNDSENR